MLYTCAAEFDFMEAEVSTNLHHFFFKFVHFLLFDSRFYDNKNFTVTTHINYQL